METCDMYGIKIENDKCDCGEWISWKLHPVPEDVKGFFILYEDGFINSDRYDYETKKRKYRDSPIVGWKFMERSDVYRKTIHQ